MKNTLLKAVCLGALMGFSTVAQATLVPVLPTTPGGTNYQAYYDDVANLTWLADANAAPTLMNWSDANTWAASLSINGVTGWRLPTTTQPDSTCDDQNSYSGYPLQGYGLNCTGSEMGNLFYNVLGGTAGTSIALTHNSNYDLFSNVQPASYWSATGVAPVDQSAWTFIFSNGYQSAALKTTNGQDYAWAVHSGNVEQSVGTGRNPLPEPDSLFLMVAGLTGLVARGRFAGRAGSVIK